MIPRLLLPALTAGSLLLSALAQGPTPLVTRTAAEHLATLRGEAPRKAKADACRELAVIGGPDAVPVLVELLADPDLHHMARYALEAMPDPAVNDALRARLNTLKGRPLVGVIGSLGVRKDLQAEEPFSRLVWDADPEVAAAAARALGRLGTPGALRALMNAAASAPPDLFPDLVEGLGRAAEALVAAGRRDLVLDLFDRYQDTDLPPQVRAGALRGALLARGADGATLLRELLRSRDYTLFAAAVQTSFEMPGSAITRVLADALPSLPVADHQIVLAGALGHRGDAAALPALAAQAGRGPKPVQLAALKALAMLGADEAIPVFLPRLSDSDREIAQAAREGLASLPGRAADEAILGLLKDERAAQQTLGIELAGRRRMIAALPTLLSLTRQGEPPVRTAALRQIGELGGEAEASPVLDLLLADREERIGNAAQQALIALAARAPDAAALSTRVIAALERARGAAKAALLNVLAATGGPAALKAVRAACEDPDDDVRAAAVRALSAWKTADAAPALLELATRSGREADRRLALSGYLEMAGNPDLPAGQRLEMCRHAARLAQSPEDKRRLLAALGQIPSLAAAEVAAPHLEDPALRNEAGAALVAIATRLVRGELSGPDARRLAEWLDRAGAALTNAEQARRARNLAEQARKKAGS